MENPKTGGLGNKINMVYIAAMGATALVNAMALSGSNYLFGKLGGAEKWHDLYTEIHQIFISLVSRKKVITW